MSTQQSQECKGSVWCLSGQGNHLLCVGDEEDMSKSSFMRFMRLSGCAGVGAGIAANAVKLGRAMGAMDAAAAGGTPKLPKPIVGCMVCA